MAGSFRPDDSMLIGSGVEGTNYTVISESSYMKDSSALFDGIYNGKVVETFYWYKGRAQSLVMQINFSCNLYRYSNVEVNHSKTLVMKKLNELTGVYEDVSSLYEKSLTETAGWQIFAENVPAGTYTFLPPLNGNRCDEEWFIEICNSVLVKSNGMYYCPTESFYNQEASMFNPLDITDEEFNLDFLYKNGCSEESLKTQIVTESETFYPLSKFSSVQFIASTPAKFFAKGLKSNKELIVSKEILLPYFLELNEITADYEKDNSNYIYFIYSFDGDNWIFPSGYNQPENFHVSNANYEDLSESEKEQWNLSKDIIFNNGFQIEGINEIDWKNVIKDEDGNNYNSIRFAFVVNNNDISTESKINSISVNYDVDGRFIQTTEPTISIQGDTVRMKPNMEKEQFKIILSL